MPVGGEITFQFYGNHWPNPIEMLVPENSIIICHFYMGPGSGCRQVMRCDLFGFIRDLDCHDRRRAKEDAFGEIQDIAFQRFRDGKYTIQPIARHELALSIVERNTSSLIELMFDDDRFVRDLVVRELTRRGIMDREIYRIGEFGNQNARSAAIGILKAKLDSDSTSLLASRIIVG